MGALRPNGYPYSISAEWEAPWRTERIYHVLESGRKFSAADMLALENDVHSENDLFAAERFVYAVDHASKPSAACKTGRRSHAQLGWAHAGLFNCSHDCRRARLEELTRLLLEPRLGPAPEDPKQGKQP